MFLSKPLGVLLCCSASLLCPGCFSTETTEPGEANDGNPPPGFFILRWSIENSTSASMCSLFGASDLEVFIYDYYGSDQRKVANCDDFELTVKSLPIGRYSATATLVNTSGQAVSTTLPIHAIQILPQGIVVPIDFPAASKL